MELEALISAIDFAFDTKRKRHVIGGIMLSFAALFGGIALTAMTVRKD